MGQAMKNRAQATIWIIVALIIVAIIALVFVFKPAITGTTQTQLNPEPIIGTCIANSVDEAVGKLLPRGGFINPNNSKLYENINVSYLCDNIGYFRPCINQHPLLIGEIEQQINNYINPAMDSCFDSIKTDLEQRQNNVTLGKMSLSVTLEQGDVNVHIDRNLTIEKNGQSQIYDHFDERITSPIYDLTRVAQEITNQEATNCYFEYAGFMILYPRFSIAVHTQSDSTKIYSIKDNYSNKAMNIAIRGCRISPGI